MGRLPEASDRCERREQVHAVDGAPSSATVSAVEDTGDIDEAGICEGWCDDDDSGAEFLPLTALVKNTLVHGTLLNMDVIWVFRMCENTIGLSILSGRKLMLSYDVFGPGGRVILHAQTPFVQSGVKWPLLSVGKLTKSGAEVKFGRKGSWVDLHTDTGMQRVLVRVKGETFGLSIQKTDASIIPGTSGPARRAVVAAAPRPEETQGMRLEREARDFAAAWQRSRQLGRPLGEGGLTSGSNVENMRNRLKTLGPPVWGTKAQMWPQDESRELAEGGRQGELRVSRAPDEHQQMNEHAMK